MAKPKEPSEGKDFERKSFPFFAKADAKTGRVQGIVAVFGNVDEGGDIIMPGAFVKTLSERGPKVRVLDQHRSYSVRFVVGKPVELREVGRDALPPDVTALFPDATGGLYADLQFAMETEGGREIFTLIDGGFVDEFSIGYDPMVANFEDIERNGGTMNVRYLRELRLWDVSPVVWGMNQATRVTGTKGLLTDLRETLEEQQKAQLDELLAQLRTAEEDKAALPASSYPLADRDRPWSASEAKARCRAWAGGEDISWAKYRKCFFWYDAEKPELFGSYKLGYVDIIGDAPHIIPRAVFAVAAVLSGARGGVDIPEADQTRIKGSVARLYARMAREFDDDTIVVPWKKADDGSDKETFDTARITRARALAHELNELLGGTAAQEDEEKQGEKAASEGDAEENTDAATGDGAGSDDQPPTSDDVRTSLTEIERQISEVNDVLARGPAGGENAL